MSCDTELFVVMQNKTAKKKTRFRCKDESLPVTNVHVARTTPFKHLKLLNV